MEIVGGILLALVAMVLLAGLGIASLVAFAIMGVLGLITEISFKRLFFIGFGVGILVPLLLGMATMSALADGSLERELRDELGQVVQLPVDGGNAWSEALPRLQEISRDRERGAITEAEAERRIEEIVSDFGDLQISIDLDGDGVSGSGDASDVVIDVPETGEAPANGAP